MTTPEEWFNSIPYMTKRIWLIAFIFSALATLGVVSPYNLALLEHEIFKGWQFWRLFTSFFFLGPISMQWIFSMSLLLQYCRNFETTDFYHPRQKLDFLWVLGIGMSIFATLSLFCRPVYFPAQQLIVYMGYLWSRKDPMRPINFYGFTLKAWHTPLILILMDLVFGQSIVDTVIAVLVGHFVHVVRNMAPLRWQVAPFKCPEFLMDLSEKWYTHSATNSLGGGDSTVQREQARQRPAWAQGSGHRLN